MAGDKPTPSPAAWKPARFVPLPENRSALLAIRRLAAARRCPFHPLLLHGPPGTGKSHLADALHEHMAESRSCHRIDAADWASDALAEVRRCDLLIVEDVQHLRQRAEDEFAGVLDYRLSRGQATLITASCGPAHLHLPGRLNNRLAGGLVVGLEALGRQSRRRFLARELKRRRMPFEAATVKWLADRTPGSGRQLLAAANRLQALSARATLPVVQDAFRAEATAGAPTLEGITQRVSLMFRVKPRQVRGQERTPQLLWPRQLCMYLARQLTPLSLGQIGKYYERDQSTVRHACQKVAQALTRDAELSGLLRQLQSGIG